MADYLISLKSHKHKQTHEIVLFSFIDCIIIIIAYEIVYIFHAFIITISFFPISILFFGLVKRFIYQQI